MACFSLGLNSYKVSMSVHAENRQKLISWFHERYGSEVDSNSVILLQGGEDIYHYDTDHQRLFRQESNFNWCFGVPEPDCFGAIHLGTKKSILFVPRLPVEYAVWMGKIQPPEHFKGRFEVDEVRFTDDLDQVLGQELKVNTIFTLYGLNSDSGRYAQEAKFKGIEKYKVDNKKLHPVLHECRVFKSKAEIDLLRWINKVSTEAHIYVMKKAKPGMAEYQLEAMFLKFVYKNYGCRNVAYTCVCPSGDNCAVLHYGHAGAPNDKLIQDGDMLLLDMGAEYHCYTSDITCSFPANGKFTQKQKEIFEIVADAQSSVEKAMKPGVLWPDMHRLAERVILGGLQKIGVIKADANMDEMMAVRLGAIFMPHGLGHFMGCDTHDVGGYPEGVTRSSEAGLKSLRTARVLKEGMVLTVEPGLYFIDILLDEALSNPAKNKFLVAEKLNEFRKFGGVRLEDDVVVTADGIENLSSGCPRTVAEVEAIMSSGTKK